MKKAARFLGDTKETIRAFPEDARREAGYQLDLVQDGFDPLDWKPPPVIGAGVREIRIKERSGAFRVIYLASLADVVLVLNLSRKRPKRLRSTRSTRLASG